MSSATCSITPAHSTTRCRASRSPPPSATRRHDVRPAPRPRRARRASRVRAAPRPAQQAAAHAPPLGQRLRLLARWEAVKGAHLLPFDRERAPRDLAVGEAPHRRHLRRRLGRRAPGVRRQAALRHAREPLRDRRERRVGAQPASHQQARRDHPRAPDPAPAVQVAARPRVGRAIEEVDDREQALVARDAHVGDRRAHAHDVAATGRVRRSASKSRRPSRVSVGAAMSAVPMPRSASRRAAATSRSTWPGYSAAWMRVPSRR